MREILFRGKRADNGEWAFGNLIEDKWGDDNGNTVYAILQDRVAPDIAALWTPVKVIPETVGQFIGLTDKNGKKIFEGDIVKLFDEYVAVIIFESARFLVKCEGYNLQFSLEDSPDIEVIGTIYDNPELLEVEE